MGILQTAQGFRGTAADTLEALARGLRDGQEARAGAGAMVAIMRCLALSGRSGLPGAVQIAVEHRCVDRVTSVLRAAVDAGTMDNSAALVALKPASDGFLAAIRSASAIDQIVAAGGFRVQGLLERIGRVEVGGTAYSVDENMAKPATRMSLLDLDALRSRKVSVWVTVTSEVFRFGNPSAATIINDNLGPALAVALDKDAFEQLISTSTPTRFRPAIQWLISSFSPAMLRVVWARGCFSLAERTQSKPLPCMRQKAACGYSIRSASMAASLLACRVWSARP